MVRVTSLAPFQRTLLSSLTITVTIEEFFETFKLASVFTLLVEVTEKRSHEIGWGRGVMMRVRGVIVRVRVERE